MEEPREGVGVKDQSDKNPPSTKRAPLVADEEKPLLLPPLLLLLPLVLGLPLPLPPLPLLPPAMASVLQQTLESINWWTR